MNIFYLDHNQKKCAEYLYDKHVVKMILEYAQILSTTHRLLDGEQAPDILYKATHKNHPCTIWARESSGNYTWLADLLKETCKEYTHRYGKIHLTERKAIVDVLQQLPKNIETGIFFEPPQCMPDECKGNTAIDGYRKLYATEKFYLMAYKNRELPDWLANLRNEPIKITNTRKS